MTATVTERDNRFECFNEWSSAPGLPMPAEQPLVFVVDDDPMVRTLLDRWLDIGGFEISSLSSGDSCMQALTEELPSVILLDVNMPGTDGMEILRQIREHNPLIPVVMLTANDGVETVVRAMKLGAYDYLTKPLDRTKLLTTVKNAAEHGRLSFRVAQLEREVEGRGYAGIVGNSPEMQRIFRQLDRLSKSDVSVLIHGESGTGKELVARALHMSGGRSRGPFVAVNSAAIPESLLESELFGHEKGAFTGAVARRAGRFEEANKGTIFLDEIGELSPAVQAKLLRVLQERKFQRLGGQATITSDFRLITATHRNLAEDVDTGRFRQDLYFRLAVFDLEIPPLRQRLEDIPALAQAFIQQFGRESGATADVLSPEALQVLLAYKWPGNVRELQNVIQRALVVAEGSEIRVADLPARLRGTSEIASPTPQNAVVDDGATLLDVSRKLVHTTLIKHAGNASAVMRELGIGRTRFYRMLKSFDLEETMNQLRQNSKTPE